MIVCHCQHITDHDINAAINWMRASDDKTIITPGKIYRALGKAADCGGCMPLFLSTMRNNNNQHYAQQQQPARPHAIAELETRNHTGRNK